MPWEDLPAFLEVLRSKEENIPAECLAFQILCATRPGETSGAYWTEIDLAGRIWTIPAERMKKHREHRVPLSDQAVAILERMAAVRVNDLIFPARCMNIALNALKSR